MRHVWGSLWGTQVHHFPMGRSAGAGISVGQKQRVSADLWASAGWHCRTTAAAKLGNEREWLATYSLPPLRELLARPITDNSEELGASVGDANVCQMPDTSQPRSHTFLLRLRSSATDAISLALEPRPGPCCVPRLRMAFAASGSAISSADAWSTLR